MRVKWLLFAAIAVLAAIAAAGLALLRNRTAGAGGAAQQPPQAVQAAPAAGDVSLPGKIRAQQVIAIPAPVEGTLDELLVATGDRVYEGQLLGRIKNTGLETAYQEANADADRARERISRLENEMLALRLEASRARSDATRAQMVFDRAQSFYQKQKLWVDEGATPRLVYEKALKDYETARNERDSLDALARAAEERLQSVIKGYDTAKKVAEEKEAALEDVTTERAAAEIHAPAEGIIVAQARQAGEEVNTDVKDLLQIGVDLAQLEVVVEPEPPVLARVREGQEAVIALAGLPDIIPGKVRKIEKTQVIVEFVSPNANILPGLTAQVRIKTAP